MAAPEHPLFTGNDLSGVLRYPVDGAAAATAERVLWGRVMPILSATERPHPCPDDVFAIVFQLGILFYENPGLWSKSSTGADSTDYNTVAQMNALFDELRLLAKTSGGNPSPEAGVSSPRGLFPPPIAYPDGASSGSWSAGGYGRSW